VSSSPLSAAARRVPVHPEPVAGRPDVLRWVVPADTLPTGVVRRAPGRLGALLDAGELTDGLAERAALWLRLTRGSWSERGAEVRGALQEALLDAAAWELDAPDDAGLQQVTEDVLSGPVGDYVRSHGGRIGVAVVRDGVVEVDLAGTCEHCPAAGLTLHARIESAVRERWPALVAVRDVTGAADRHDPADARAALSRWLRLGRD
jgi:Fe/S biogenesis protein NfuA